MTDRPAPDKTESTSFALQTARRYGEELAWADVAAMADCLELQAARSAHLDALGRFFTSFGSISSIKTAGRYTLLRILYFAEGSPLTQVEISGEMAVTSANVTYLLDMLEKEGLVARRPHPTDRRVTLVELTPEGTALCQRLVPGMAGLMAQMLAGFSEDEKQQFGDLLTRFRQNAESYNASEGDASPAQP